MLGAIKKYMADGNLFACSALTIEQHGSAAWVVERETGVGIKLYASPALARTAIEKAVRAYERSCQ